MKNSISIQPGTGLVQRVKWQYVSLAAGLALATTAALSLDGRTHDAAIPAPQRSVHPQRQFLSLGGESVVFYLTAAPDQTARVNHIEEEAQWMRLEGGSPEPKRSIHILDAGTVDQAQRAQKFIDDAMAAASFTSTEAPRFIVVDLR